MSSLPRFHRTTKSGQFMPVVDGLRFLAIAVVVLFHLTGYVGAGDPATQASVISPEIARPWPSLLYAKEWVGGDSMSVDPI